MSDVSGSATKIEKKSANLVNKVPVAKKPITKTTHPNTAKMVKAAIKTLDERRGSSLRAIKKYIVTTYQIDADKLAPYIKKFLKSSVIKGTVIQTKGTGAGGSFKLAVEKASKAKATAKKTSDEAKTSVEKAAAFKKVTVDKSPKKAATKSTKSKAAVEKPAASKVEAKSPIKSKAAAPSKTKKIVKSPTAKPKSPKPTKIATS